MGLNSGLTQSSDMNDTRFWQPGPYQGVEILQSTYSRHICAPYFLEKYKVGIGLHSYQTIQRVNQGRKLLQHGAPPTQVALETGFLDQSHFTNWFKRVTGITPAVYRGAFE